MQKVRLNFDVDEWLALDLEKYGAEHLELETNKDRVQSFILSLKEQLSGLEAQVHYLQEAEKSGAALAVSSQHQDSIPHNISQPEPRPTQEPQILRPREFTAWRTRLADKAPANPERIIELCNFTASLNSGTWTFVKKKERALALRTEQTTSMIAPDDGIDRKFANLELAFKMKEDHQRRMENIKTEGKTARANIHRKGQREGGSGEITDSSPYGGPVDDALRRQYTS